MQSQQQETVIPPWSSGDVIGATAGYSRSPIELLRPTFRVFVLKTLSEYSTVVFGIWSFMVYRKCAGAF